MVEVLVMRKSWFEKRIRVGGGGWMDVLILLLYGLLAKRAV